MVSTNGLHSNPFPIFRGTQQGCGLLPSLFILSLEPLAQRLRENQVITPIRIKKSLHAISAFADDVLIYLSDIEKSITSLLATVEEFRMLSGYKSNWMKSALMPLNEPAKTVVLPYGIPIKTEITYLGIEILPSLHNIVKTNYGNIFKEVEHDIVVWTKLPASLHTRIASVKMNVLPRLNFVSMMILLPPPVGHWKRIDSLLRKYIWNNGHPKIKLSTLQRSKQEGGLAFPNFLKYHQAFQLRPLQTWLDRSSQAAWRDIEEALVLPYKLEGVLFSGLSINQCMLRFGPIITNSIRNFKVVEKSLVGNWKWHLNTPLWGNKNFISGNKPFESASWSAKGVYNLGDLFDPRGMLGFQTLCSLFNLPTTSHFLYLRLRSALHACGVQTNSEL